MHRLRTPKDILPLLPRPSRYLGNEVNSIHKDVSEVEARVALAFPDIYDIGMSYLGQKILYHEVNSFPEFWAERVFAPDLEAGKIFKAEGVTLATLESDTPLAMLDVVAFSLTHELCYTNILYMLDLAGIALRSEDRKGLPLIIAGGGCTYNAEPVAPFLDAMVIGDGEAALPAILKVVSKSKASGSERNELLRNLSAIKGVYVPSLRGEKKSLPEPIKRTALADLDVCKFPGKQIVPFAKPIHDRLAVEISRGCSRGCRFCQAGMIYRPVRERGVDTLMESIKEGLLETGFEELSFLSLSTGDFTGLDSLFGSCFSHCQQEQVSISFPSLRVGSLNPELLAALGRLKKTGLTIAPEAGTQRLRDVINKCITEEEILEHARMVFDAGWEAIKLYFMIGLPGEKPEDLDGILDLSLKVLNSASVSNKRQRVTVALSPFVPKPQTPFQWERQIDLEEVEERINYLRTICKPYKRLTVKWHHSHMSFLEGVFSRGGRELAGAVEDAFNDGAFFCSWTDHLNLSQWLNIFVKRGVDPKNYLSVRDTEKPLPWSHLHSGVSTDFLLRERNRGMNEKKTPDCRFGACSACGVCDNSAAIVPGSKSGSEISPVLNSADHSKTTFLQNDDLEDKGDMRAVLGVKGGHYRIWFSKQEFSVYLSQLEVQRIMERAFRRAKIGLSFSQGFNPMPLLSFGKALPVGVASQGEWMSFFTRENLSVKDILKGLENCFPSGMAVKKVETLGLKDKPRDPLTDEYLLTCSAEKADNAIRDSLAAFWASEKFEVAKKGKRGKVKQVDLRVLVNEFAWVSDSQLRICFDWEKGYFNPLKFVAEICPQLSMTDFRLEKVYNN